MNSKKLVLFDIGGVLIKLNFKKFYESCAKFTNITPEEFEYRYNASQIELMSLEGRISQRDFKEKLKSIIEKENLTDRELEMTIKQTWEGEIEEVLDLKEELSSIPNLFVGLFSNINEFGFDYFLRTYPRLGLSGKKGPVFCSHQIGEVKPGLAMYQEAQFFARENRIQNVLLIEDKDSYLKTGINYFGWKGIHLTPFIDNSESIRSEKGHNDSYSHPHLKTAKDIQELRNYLAEFGLF